MAHHSLEPPRMRNKWWYFILFKMFWTCGVKWHFDYIYGIVRCLQLLKCRHKHISVVSVPLNERFKHTPKWMKNCQAGKSAHTHTHPQNEMEPSAAEHWTERQANQRRQCGFICRIVTFWLLLIYPNIKRAFHGMYQYKWWLQNKAKITWGYLLWWRFCFARFLLCVPKIQQHAFDLPKPSCKQNEKNQQWLFRSMPLELNVVIF